MKPQPWLAEPLNDVSLPWNGQTAIGEKPVPATGLTELEEQILSAWAQAEARQGAPADDHARLAFRINGLDHTLTPCQDDEARFVSAVHLPSGRSWEIQVSPGSCEACQTVMLPLDEPGASDRRSGNPEAIREDIEDMLALKKLLPRFHLFSGAPGAETSREHRRFQGFLAAEGESLPIERQAARGVWKQEDFWLAQVEGWPAECLRMRGRPASLAAWTAQAIQTAASQGLACHLLITNTALYFARGKLLSSPRLGIAHADARDVFVLQHRVSRPVFERAAAESAQVPRELEAFYADIAPGPADATAFVQEVATQLAEGSGHPRAAIAGSMQAQEATVLDILAACASKDQAVHAAARARLDAFIRDESAKRKAEMAGAPGGQKLTRFIRWAEPHLRPADVRTRDTYEVNQGLQFTDALIEASRCLKCKEPFCTNGCPVGMDIRGFLKAILDGDVKEAYAIIEEDNTMASITCRVCPQETQCQATCALSKRGDALSIGLLERAVVELSELFCACNIITDGVCSSHADRVAPEKDYPIAIIGAGPAGLTAAAELARRYSRVYIFEALPQPGGGVLKYGIPGFRLPKQVVQDELATVRSRGVKMIFDVAIGRTLTIDDLRQMGFRAVLMGTGAGLPKFMGIPGEELNGVVTANEFLMRYNLMSAGQPGYDTPIRVGRKVVIIGGGNVAMDAARSAARAGAEEVIVMYRRAEEDMPVRAEEKDRAKEEGILIMPLTAPLEFHGENGMLASIRCQKMDLGKPDESGRRSPVPIAGSEFIIDGVTTVVQAIGTEPNTMLLDQEGLPKAKWNTVVLENEHTGQTKQPDIFAAGDVAGGSTVIEAMGTARKAVAGIHAYLQTLSEDARRIALDKRLLQTEQYRVTHKEVLARNNILLKVHAPFVASAAHAGQFVMVMNDEKAERIPLTLADWDAESGEITLVIQPIGVSTLKLSRRNPGECLFSVAGALGKPSDVSHDPDRDVVVCVAGGVGIAPIYPIARANVRAGNQVVSIIGVRSRDLMFWEDRLRELSVSFTLTLDSEGQLVTDGLKAFLEEQKATGGLGRIARIVAIGSAGMMKAVSDLAAPYGVPTVVSLNSIMLCGIGMCGCDRENVGGQRVFTCVHGPEFDSRLVDWNGVMARQRRYVKEERQALERAS
jgi:glutamate synthase (NADPH/NADH) small chain